MGKNRQMQSSVLKKPRKPKKPNPGNYDHRSEAMELRCSPVFKIVLKLLIQENTQNKVMSMADVIHHAVQCYAKQYLDEKHKDIVNRIIHVEPVLL